mgnify:CR=1 FL=1
MYKQCIFLGIITLFITTILSASDLRREINLRGRWKFEIGDNMKWAEPDFDDSDWKSVYVPDNWEDNGYPGYDGYAWYRKSIQFPTRLKNDNLYLLLGQIDDVDAVFLNGVKIGSAGQFPPEYRTAYNVHREYFIPKNLIRFDKKNVISVRVYDDQLQGGIIQGNIGIYSVKRYLAPDIDLGGYWKFKTGDRDLWANEAYNDSHWDQIIVPGFWEGQGYIDYDGFAWYRKRVVIPSEFRKEELILMLGKIDDVDQVFLNGVRIGGTGPIPQNNYIGQYGQWYQQVRAYYIPDNVVKIGEENLIAIRVYDAWLDGGIYDIPIGIFKKERYQKAEQRQENIWNLFDHIFN